MCGNVHCAMQWILALKKHRKSHIQRNTKYKLTGIPVYYNCNTNSKAWYLTFDMTWALNAMTVYYKNGLISRQCSFAPCCVTDHFYNTVRHVWRHLCRTHAQCCGSGSMIRCLFDPLIGWSAMGKKSGSRMNHPDHISESLKTISWVKILKFFDADPGFGMVKIRIRDGKNFDLDPDKHTGSATLPIPVPDGESNPTSCWACPHNHDAAVPQLLRRHPLHLQGTVQARQHSCCRTLQNKHCNQSIIQNVLY